MRRAVAVAVGAGLAWAATCRGQGAAVAPRVASPPVIEAVRIDRADVYTGAEARALWYARLANRLHRVTRERVVKRELLLAPGEPMDSARAAETARNLRRLGLFTEVEVDTVRRNDGTLALDVRTHDGWTTRPAAGVRAVGGQTLVSAALIETNAFGLGGTLDLRYIDDPDRSMLRAELLMPRVVNDRVTLGASATRFSDGRAGFVLAERPWFSLATRGAWRAVGTLVDGRVLRFREGTLVATDSLTRRQLLAVVEAGHALRASPRGYLRVGATAQWRQEDFAPRGAPITGYTTTVAVTPWVEALRARFAVVRNYRLLGPQEDVDLSTAVRAGVAVAPAAFGYARGGVGPLLVARTGRRFGDRAFGLASVRASGLASGGAIDSGTVSMNATLAWQPDARQLLVLHGNAAWARDPWPGAEFDLGLVRGPRAFPLHAFTGDRQRFVMAEYRWTIPYAFARTGVAALAAFAEAGGAWFAGDRPRWGQDVGAGLRLGSLRTPSGFGALRLDLAYRFANDRLPAGTVFVVGSGFPFDFLR